MGDGQQAKIIHKNKLLAEAGAGENAVAIAMHEALKNPDKSILINMPGRGNKDIDHVAENFGFSVPFSLPAETPTGGL